VPPREKAFPANHEPMMASLIKDPFDSPDWIFEIKMDGYRAIAMTDSAGKARIWSRNRLPLKPKFPTVRDAVGELNLRSTILDGEIVALDEKGCPASNCFKNGKNFQLSMRSSHGKRERLRSSCRSWFCASHVPPNRLSFQAAEEA
jgi:ATP-dependent DNA ligase